MIKTTTTTEQTDCQCFAIIITFLTVKFVFFSQKMHAVV